MNRTILSGTTHGFELYDLKEVTFLLSRGRSATTGAEARHITCLASSVRSQLHENWNCRFTECRQINFV